MRSGGTETILKTHSGKPQKREILRRPGWDKVAPIMVGRRKPVNLQFWTNAEITVDRDRRPTSASATKLRSVPAVPPYTHLRPRIAKGHLDTNAASLAAYGPFGFKAR